MIKIKSLFSYYVFLLLTAIFYPSTALSLTVEQQAKHIIDSSELAQKIKATTKNNLSFYVEGLTARLADRSPKENGVAKVRRFYLSSGGVITPTAELGRISILLNSEGELISAIIESGAKINLKLISLLAQVHEMSIDDALLQDGDVLDLSQFSSLISLNVNSLQLKKLLLPVKSKLKMLQMVGSKFDYVEGFQWQNDLEYMNLYSSINHGYRELEGNLSLKELIIFFGLEVLDVGKIKNLKKLIVYKPKYKDLLNISYLKDIENLALWFVDDKAISSITLPVSLKHITVDRTIFASIPKVVNLPNLEDAFFRGLDGFDFKLFSNIPNLNKLSVIKSNVENLDNLDTITSVTSLDLSENKITDISNLSKLVNLESVNLERNKITSVKPLFSLKNINKIYVSHNNISSVMPMGESTSVKYIDYSSNPIKTLDLNMLENYPFITFILYATPYWDNLSQEEFMKIKNLRQKGHF